MTIKDALRYTLIAGTFLVPFIPLIVSESMFFPYITGKGFSFRILVEVLFGVWVVLAIMEPAYRPKFSWLLASLAMFVGWIFVADLFSPNVFKSFFSNFERMEGWITLFHLLLYFVITISVLTTERLWYWFWHISIAVATVIGIQGMLEIREYLFNGVGGSRIDVTLGNPTYLAVYTLFHIFIAIQYALRDGLRWFYRLPYAFFVLLMLVTLYYTATRGAILGFLGGITLAAIIAAFLSQKKQLRYGSGILLILLALGAGVFFMNRDSAFVTSSPVLNRFASISLTDTTTISRFMIWNMAYEGFKERPVLGWGQESFNYVFNQHYNPLMYKQEQWFDRVHNIFLDWLIAGGVLGFALYLSLFGIALYYLWLSKKGDFTATEKAIFTGLLGAYMVHNIFVFDNLISYVFFVSLLAYLHTRTTKDEPTLFAEKRISEKTVYTMVAPAVFVITAVSVYAINIPGIQTARLLIDTYSPQEGGVLVNLAMYQEAYAKNSVGKQETAEQVIQAALQVVNADTVTQEEKQKFSAGAVAILQSEIDQYPDDARLQLFLGTFLNGAGQPGEASESLKKALALSPKKQTIYYELGLASINGGDTKMGVEYMKTAFDLAPSNEQAAVFYAVALIYDDRLAEAKAFLTEQVGTHILDNNTLLTSYYNAKDMASVVAIWELRASTDNESLLGLAAAYLNSGDKKKARETLVRMQEAFPDRAEEIASYLQEVDAMR